MKIWNSKNQKINQKVDTFLSGEDIRLDNEIFIFDVDGTLTESRKVIKQNMVDTLKKLKTIDSSNLFSRSRVFIFCYFYLF